MREATVKLVGRWRCAISVEVINDRRDTHVEAAEVQASLGKTLRCYELCTVSNVPVQVDHALVQRQQIGCRRFEEVQLEEGRLEHLWVVVRGVEVFAYVRHDLLDAVVLGTKALEVLNRLCYLCLEAGDVPAIDAGRVKHGLKGCRRKAQLIFHALNSRLIDEVACYLVRERWLREHRRRIVALQVERLLEELDDALDYVGVALGELAFRPKEVYYP